MGILKCNEEGLTRLKKILQYEHGFNNISYIESGKWEIQPDRPNGKYVGKFNNGLTIEIKPGAYIVVYIKRKGDKFSDTFYLDNIDEAFYLVNGIVFGSSFSL